MTETRNDALNRMTAEYTALYDHVRAEVPDARPLNPRLLREALAQNIAKTGRLRYLKNPPTYAERPLGHAYAILKRWHQGNGQLDSRTILKWRLSADAVRSSLPSELARLVPATDADLFTAIDQAVLITARGKSSATEAWTRAIGTVPA